MRKRAALLAASAVLAATPAIAQTPETSPGDTAWILTSSALVLFMTMPGLALFYGGLVQRKNVLSVMMQCIAIAALASLLWLVVGYSLAFGTGGPFLGGLGEAFLPGARDGVVGVLPESVFFLFQMTFAAITPALIVGAYVERANFGAMVLISAAWLLLVYAPVAHWVWGGGWLASLGVKDFAGGLVVHATAGASALVLAHAFGPRVGFPRELHPPHSPGMTMMGAAMLWVGWFGFNGGSALLANAQAGGAIVATHIAACAAAVTWCAIEWARFRRPSMIGAVTGLVAGLATVTPASGFVGPVGGLILGVAGGALCFYAVPLVKNRLKIDDSLDVAAVHGVGGVLGVLLLPLLMPLALGGEGFIGGNDLGHQFGVQLIGVIVTLAWSALVTWLIARAVGAVIRLRAPDEQLREGLDLAQHGERAQPDQ